MKKMRKGLLVVLLLLAVILARMPDVYADTIEQAENVPLTGTQEGVYDSPVFPSENNTAGYGFTSGSPFQTNPMFYPQMPTGWEIYENQQRAAAMLYIDQYLVYRPVP